jgi:hypothetical protein
MGQGMGYPSFLKTFFLYGCQTAGIPNWSLGQEGLSTEIRR